jgi:hypothetical protein
MDKPTAQSTGGAQRDPLAEDERDDLPLMSALNFMTLTAPAISIMMPM